MYRLTEKLNINERAHEAIHKPLLSGFLTAYALWFDLSSQMREYLVLENGYTDLEPETRIIAHSPNLQDALSFASAALSPGFSTALERRRIIRGPMLPEKDADDKKAQIPPHAYVISFPPFDVVFVGGAQKKTEKNEKKKKKKKEKKKKKK